MIFIFQNLSNQLIANQIVQDAIKQFNKRYASKKYSFNIPVHQNKKHIFPPLDKYSKQIVLMSTLSQKYLQFFIIIQIINMIQSQHISAILKIFLVGGLKVGKTSILSRFIDGNLEQNKQAQDQSMKLRIKTLVISDKTIKIQLWVKNSTTQIKNEELANSDAVVIIVDLTKPSQVENLLKLYGIIEAKAPQKAIVMVLGNKCEQKNSEIEERVNKIINEKNILYFETSATINYNIDVAMNSLIKKILSKQKKNPIIFQIDPIAKALSKIRMQNYKEKPQVRFSQQQEKYLSLVRCIFCNYLPVQPFETDCCSDVYCEKCQNLFLLKDYCQTCDRYNVTIKKSKFAQKLIQKISAKCPNECGQTISIRSLKQHLELFCDLKKLKCKLCEQQLQMKELYDHYENKHLESLYSQVQRLHQEKEKIESIIKERQKSQIAHSISPFIGSRKNKLNRQAIFGINGKYYCKVKIKLSQIQTQCCQVTNCDSCMQLNILRLGLKKPYLLNCGGYISKYEGQKEQCYCGRQIRVSIFSSASNECTVFSPCTQCGKLSALIKFGMYRQFI